MYIPWAINRVQNQREITEEWQWLENATAILRIYAKEQFTKVYYLETKLYILTDKNKEYAVKHN